MLSFYFAIAMHPLLLPIFVQSQRAQKCNSRDSTGDQAMQLNGHLNGGVRAPRSRLSPQPPHPQQQRSVTTDIAWLMASWKSILMVLIASIIFALPILSKASPTPFDSLIARDETAPSCAVGCIESFALVAGCVQSDVACRCRIGFDPDATVQDKIFRCMSGCETLDLDDYYKYASTVCQVDAPVKRDGAIKPDVMLAFDDTAATASAVNSWEQQTKPTNFPNVPDEAFIAPPQTPNQKDGMSLPAKLAIGIVIPVFVLVCIWAAMKQLKKRKAQKTEKLPVVGGSVQDTEGGGVVTGHKAELPGGVVMMEEQENVDNRPSWERKLAGQNEEVELEAQERKRFDAQPRAVEISQEAAVVTPPAQNQLYGSQTYSQMYSPPCQGIAELYTPSAYQSGSHTEMDGQSPRDIHELNPASIGQVTSPAPTYISNTSASPQQNIARSVDCTSPLDEMIGRSQSSKEVRASQPSPLAGPVPAALDLYPQTAESDKAAIVEEERRLAAKRAVIAERKRLVEEEEQLEREEEALRRKKGAKRAN